MRVLLDTSTFIWLSSWPRRLSAVAAATIEARDVECFLSPISVFEMLQKQATGKLELDASIPELLDLARENVGLSELPLTTGQALKVERLPLYHRDPFDRILIAQALSKGLAVITSDSRFADYGVEVTW